MNSPIQPYHLSSPPSPRSLPCPARRGAEVRGLYYGKLAIFSLMLGNFSAFWERHLFSCHQCHALELLLRCENVNYFKVGILLGVTQPQHLGYSQCIRTQLDPSLQESRLLGLRHCTMWAYIYVVPVRPPICSWTLFNPYLLTSDLILEQCRHFMLVHWFEP